MQNILSIGLFGMFFIISLAYIVEGVQRKDLEQTIMFTLFAALLIFVISLLMGIEIKFY